MYKIAFPVKVYHAIFAWNSWHLKRETKQQFCSAKSFIVKMWRYVLFVPRSSLIGDGWNLNCDCARGYSQLDSSAQGKNLQGWQHLQAVLWVPRCRLPALAGRKSSPSSCNLLPFIREGGNFPREQFGAFNESRVLHAANHRSCQGLLMLAPRGRRDQEVCLAKRPRSMFGLQG